MGRGGRGRGMVYPVFGIMCNAFVVIKSMKAVGSLRHRFAIKAPSTEPNSDMDEDEKQLWYRTYRAQVNCVEWFSLTSPIFLGGAMISKKAFGPYGKYAPYAIGGLSVLHAYFRNQYLDAYIKEADKRSGAFQAAANMARPIMYIVMAACAHLMFKDARCLYKKI